MSGSCVPEILAQAEFQHAAQEPLTQAEQSRSAKRSKPLKRYAPCSCQLFVTVGTDVYGPIGSDLYASIASRRNEPHQYEPTPGLPILDSCLEALLSRTS